MKSRMAIRRPKGPSSLSPGRRPGLTFPHDFIRPVGAEYRDLSGRMICRHEYPARWAGLRDGAPLALKALGQLEAEIQQGMKELEGMLK
jgi:hypothetical protein